jgi:hypothetical protein
MQVTFSFAARLGGRLEPIYGVTPRGARQAPPVRAPAPGWFVQLKATATGLMPLRSAALNSKIKIGAREHGRRQTACELIVSGNREWRDGARSLGMPGRECRFARPNNEKLSSRHGAVNPNKVRQDLHLNCPRHWSGPFARNAQLTQPA